MEKERGLKKPAGNDPGDEFLRSMDLLEKMEMLQLMDEFHLDAPTGAGAAAAEKQGSGGKKK